jgi:hypothetical protein
MTVTAMHIKRDRKREREKEGNMGKKGKNQMQPAL